MKQIYYLSIMCLVFLFSTRTYAYDVSVDGIYYNYINNKTELEVAGADMSKFPNGKIEIPGKVNISNKDFDVTSIRSAAFSGRSGLTSITIPESVTSIGNSVFYGCTGLTSITIPKSVTSIGGSAFSDCSGLTSITIPESVTSIGANAFNGCSGLTSITIPGSVTSIGDGAFSGCSGLTSISLSNSVTSIGGSAFKGCSGLTSITIPESVTGIGGAAFQSCSGLTSITIPGSVTSIGDGAFSGCSGLTSISLSNSVTSIGGSAFKGCSGLTSITIPESVTVIGGSAFQSCSGLTSITIPESVTSIKSYAFNGCSGLTSITIPGSVTSIGDYAFEGCSNVNAITWDSEVSPRCITQYCQSKLKEVYLGEMITTIGSEAFYGCSGLTSVTIPESVTSIGNIAFYGCSGLTSITIPGSVTNIGNYAFCGCSGLTSITIPESVTSIGSYAFYGCSNVNTLTWDSNVSPRCVTQYCQSKLKEVYFGEMITTIGSEAFRDCSGLTSITISESVTSIGDYAFKGCSGLTSITIPESVTSIGNYAFCGCSGLTSITIPESVTSIRSEAFRDCTGLTSIAIPNSVTKIGDRSFADCVGLTSIIIPENVTEISNNAFSGCSELVQVILKSPSIIGKKYNSKQSLLNIFGKQVAEYILGENAERIGAYAFYGYSKFNKFILPSGMKEIGGYAFSGCSIDTIISYVNIPPTLANNNFKGVIVIVPRGTGMAYRQSANWSENPIIDDADEWLEILDNEAGTLASRILRLGITPNLISKLRVSGSINDVDWEYIKRYLSSLSYIDMEHVESNSIPAELFNGNNHLIEITLPQNIQTIGQKAFYGCINLQTVEYSENLCSIGSSAFAGCVKLSGDWIMPKSFRYLGQYAFSRTSIKSFCQTPPSTVMIGKDLYLINSTSDQTVIEWRPQLDAVENTPIVTLTTPSYKIPNSKIVLFNKNCRNISCQIQKSSNNWYADCQYRTDNSLINDWIVSAASRNFDPGEHYQFILSFNNFQIERNSNGILPKAQIIIADKDGIYGKSKFGSHAFDGCNKLEKVAISDYVKINNNVFNDCSSLKEVVIGSDCEIANGAFNGCSSLKEVTIGNNCEIVNGAFSNCSSLEDVAIGNLCTIPDGAFNGCSNLSDITVGNGCSIGKDVFSGTAINSYVSFAGNYLTEGMYSNCKNIKGPLVLQGNITNVPSTAFAGCTGITSVYLNENITNIGENAFAGCTGITSIYLNENINNIGEHAFRNCVSLDTIYALCDPLRIYSNVFDGVDYKSCTVFVPENTVGKYMTADVWRNFNNYVEIDPSKLKIDMSYDKNIIRQSEQNDILNIYHDEDLVTNFEFSETPVISFRKDDNVPLLIVTTSTETIEYPYINVHKLTFGKENNEPDDVRHVQINDNGEESMVFNMNGILVKHYKAGETIDLKDLHSGMYIVKTKSKTYKIIKK